MTGIDHTNADHLLPFQKVTSGRTWFLISYVGSQNFLKWQFLKMASKACCTTHQILICQVQKNTRSLEDEQKCIQRRLTEGMGISKLENNSFLFPQLFFDTSSILSIFVKALATTSSCLQSVDWSVQTWFGMVLMSGLLATYVQRWNFFAEFFHIKGRWSFLKAWQKHLNFFRCVKHHKSHQWTMISCKTSKCMMRKMWGGNLEHLLKII